MGCPSWSSKLQPTSPSRTRRRPDDGVFNQLSILISLAAKALTPSACLGITRPGIWQDFACPNAPNVLVQGHSHTERRTIRHQPLPLHLTLRTDDIVAMTNAALASWAVRLLTCADRSRGHDCLR